MQIRFLGTSAGELYPGMWCRCRNCDAARHGSPKDRRQSAALAIVDSQPTKSTRGQIWTPRALIDFPSEIATQAAMHRIDLSALEHLLVTHSHGDHWFPYLLRWRVRPPEQVEPGADAPHSAGGPRFTDLPVLHIHGNSAVEAVLRREIGDDLLPYAIKFHLVNVGSSFTAGDSPMIFTFFMFRPRLPS